MKELGSDMPGKKQTAHPAWDAAACNVSRALYREGAPMEEENEPREAPFCNSSINFVKTNCYADTD